MKKPRRRSARIAAKAGDDVAVDKSQFPDARNGELLLENITNLEESNVQKEEVDHRPPKRARLSSKKKKKSKRPFKRGNALPIDSQVITTKSPRFIQSFLPPGATPQKGFELQSSFGLSPEQYDPSKLTANSSPLDERAKGYIAYVPEYACDIFQWLYYREVRVYC